MIQRASAVAATLGGLLAAALVTAPAAQAAPTLTANAGDSSLPLAVPTADGTDFTNFHVDVGTDSPATNVTITASGDGISAYRAEHLATLSGHQTVTMSLAATTPGLHTVTITVTADGAAPVTTTRGNVWSPGAMIPGGGDLTGRTWAYQGYADGQAESSVRDTEMISFVNATYAYYGMPPTGSPSCTHATGSCEPYSYDPATGLVQVGNSFIGKVADDALYTDGFIPADEQDGELYSAYDAKNALRYAKAHTKLKGHWRFSSSDYPSGLIYEDVVFRKDGTYRLAFHSDGSKTRHLVGRYAVTGQGRLTFGSHGRVAQRGSLLLVEDHSGTPQPSKLGIWLILSGPNGRSPDGNLLERVK